MSKKYDGWAIKTPQGIILWYSIKRRKDILIRNEGGQQAIERLEKQGYKVVKVRLVEVE